MKLGYLLSAAAIVVATFGSVSAMDAETKEIRKASHVDAKNLAEKYKREKDAIILAGCVPGGGPYVAAAPVVAPANECTELTKAIDQADCHDYLTFKIAQIRRDVTALFAAINHGRGGGDQLTANPIVAAHAHLPAAAHPTGQTFDEVVGGFNALLAAMDYALVDAGFDVYSGNAWGSGTDHIALPTAANTAGGLVMTSFSATKTQVAAGINEVMDLFTAAVGDLDPAVNPNLAAAQALVPNGAATLPNFTQASLEAALHAIVNK